LILGAVRLALNYTNWPDYALGLVVISVPLLIILMITGGRGIGGGDIKLMAACGLFLGWKLTLLAFAIGCILGAIIHLVRMRVSDAGRVLALGPYLAAGVFTAMLWGNQLLSWYLGFFLAK
jgi:leader peptidase (prepilin peptidase)/N-methyltransferase